MKSIRSEWINARGRNAAGFYDFSRVEHVERVGGWETVFALGPLRPLRGSRAPSCDFALQSSSLRSSGDLTASPQVHLALRQPDACRRGRMARDHEPWPGGESRKRDLNHRLAAGSQASPGPSSSLCFNPASSAARQDTNAAQGRTRTRLLRRLHEYGGL